MGLSSSKRWYERISLPVYAAIAAGLLLVTFFVYFGYSHAGWYDEMKAAEKVKFWSDFGVSFGTIALALVTWASVYETQQVLRGEDARFQQSRMPMVRLFQMYPGEEPPNNTIQLRPMLWYGHDRNDIRIALINDGDGPALNVRFTATLTVQFTKQYGEGEDFIKAEYPQRNVFVSSFLARTLVQEVTFSGVAAVTAANYIYQRVAFGGVLIEYEDSFGAKYSTAYSAFDEHSSDFTLTGPYRD